MEGARGVGLVASRGVGCAIDDPAYLRPADGACAHGAGFDGDVKGCIGKVLAAECLARGCDGLYLRVGGDVSECLSEVVSATDDLVLRNDDAADGDLIRG